MTNVLLMLVVEEKALFTSVVKVWFLKMALSTHSKLSKFFSNGTAFSSYLWEVEVKQNEPPSLP